MRAKGLECRVSWIRVYGCFWGTLRIPVRAPYESSIWGLGMCKGFGLRTSRVSDSENTVTSGLGFRST